MGADLKALAREAGMLAVSRIVDLNPVMHTESSNSYGISVRKREINIDQEQAQVSRGEVADGSIVQVPSGGDELKLHVSHLDPAVSVSVSVSDSVQDIDPSGGIPPPVVNEQASAQSAIVISPMAVDAPTDTIDMPATDSTELEGLSHPQIHDMDVDMAVTAVEMRDFTAAAKSVQPTAKREGFAVVPDVTWGK